MNVRFRCVLGVATVCVVFLMTEIVAASVTVDGGRVEGTVSVFNVAFNLALEAQQTARQSYNNTAP